MKVIPSTLNKYIDTISNASKANDSETTAIAKISCLNIIQQALIEYEFEDIKHSDIVNIITLWQGKGSSNKTINNRLAPMRKLFSLAYQDGVFATDPMKGISNLKSPKQVIKARAKENIDPFSVEEVRRMMDSFEPGDSGALAVILMCLTGLRPCEVIMFNLESLNFDDKTYTVSLAKPKDKYKCTKTPSSQRTINLSTEVLSLLQQHISVGTLTTHSIDVVLQDNNSVEKRNFTPILARHSESGAHYKHTKDLDQSYYRHFLKKLNIRTRGLHQCRKTFACHAASTNLPIKWITEQLGHTDIKVFEEHYAKWIKSDNEIAPEEQLTQRLSSTPISAALTKSFPKEAVKEPTSWHVKLITHVSNLFKRAA
ncbi:site-specific integrase [Vibrio sp. B1Z05]|uniref:tyrosine-type recombinase/integrase n=1 Tax=Vibrio sp. B1Z05 TaxID=2654980 RepID=UPI00128E8504|nr:site-specific integrase [Vibrio sp. B1Z05]MPW38094.1 tyrosine-type recombinase/integrase [Vibrio sp. B1Z05]